MKILFDAQIVFSKTSIRTLFKTAVLLIAGTTTAFSACLFHDEETNTQRRQSQSKVASEIVRADRVSLTGKVIDGEITDDGSGGVKLSLTLRLYFRNASSESVLILKHDLDVVERRIIAEATDATGQKYLFRSQSYPSIDLSPEWEALRKKVDQPLPPSDVIRTVGPHETWTRETTDWFYIDKSTNIDENSKPWRTIQAASPVWLQVTFELWPINIEPRPDRERLNFGETLQRSWGSVGELQLGYLTSEPMLLDFSTFTKHMARKND